MSTYTSWLRQSALACGLALLTGCGAQASPPTSAAYPAHPTAADGSFSVALPAGWRAGNPQDLGSGVVLFLIGPVSHGGHTTVNVVEDRGHYSTLADVRAYARELKDLLRSKLGATKISALTNSSVARGPALALTDRVIGLGGHPVAETQVFVDHRHRLYVITLAGPPGAAASVEPTFRALLASWKWLP